MKNIDKALTDIHSIVVRLKNTDENGYGNCYTCDDRIVYKAGLFNTGQCGHFIKRGNTLYRYVVKASRFQCVNCNEYLSGNDEIYEQRLINEIGVVKVAEMKFKSKQDFAGWSLSEKREMLKKLRAEARELLKDKNFSVQIP